MSTMVDKARKKRLLGFCGRKVCVFRVRALLLIDWILLRCPGLESCQMPNTIT